MAVPTAAIHYCPRCGWLLRAAWLAQELLTTFAGELAVTLAPAEPGGFEVYLDGELLFSREREKRFPAARELKQRIRDRIAPGRSLGHADRPAPPESD
jgi:selenoprotein W-related protein